MTIKEARTAAGWTQEELHQRVGPSVSAIKKWESGIRKLSNWEERLIVEEIIRLSKRNTSQ